MSKHTCRILEMLIEFDWKIFWGIEVSDGNKILQLNCNGTMVWSGSFSVRVGIIGGLLWTRKWTSGFHRIWGNFLYSQQRPCSWNYSWRGTYKTCDADVPWWEMSWIFAPLRVPNWSNDIGDTNIGKIQTIFNVRKAQVSLLMYYGKFDRQRINGFSTFETQGFVFIFDRIITLCLR